MRTSRCWRRASAPTTWRGSRRITRACCRSCSRWSAGAGRPSMWRCASSRRIPGRGSQRLRDGHAESAAADAAALGQRGRIHATIRTTWCGTSSNRRAPAGIDVFRVFDCLNWVDNMRVAIEAVREQRAAVRGGDLLHRATCPIPRETKYDPRLLPRHRQAISRPWARTCSRSRTWPACAGRGAAAHAGQSAQGGDGAAGTFPYPRHQRHRGGQRARRDRGGCGRGGRRHRRALRAHLAAESRLDRRGPALRAARYRCSMPITLRAISAYWEQVRHGYVAFESDIRAGTSEVYVHGMPGGQYTNLREQARSLGIDDHRWPEVAPHLRRGQRDVRRHHQGDAHLQGGRRHGHHDGDERAYPRGGAGSRRGDRVPGVGGATVPRRTRTAGRRLSEGVAGEGARRQNAARRAPGRAPAAGRSRGGASAARGEDRPHHQRVRARLVSHVSEGIRGLRGRSRAPSAT